MHLQITLVDRTERFVFKPLLYELIQGAATPDEVAPRFEQLLAPYSTNFIQVSNRAPGAAAAARLFHCPLVIQCHAVHGTALAVALSCITPAALLALLNQSLVLQGTVQSVEPKQAAGNGGSAGGDAI